MHHFLIIARNMILAYVLVYAVVHIFAPRRVVEAIGQSSVADWAALAVVGGVAVIAVSL